MNVSLVVNENLCIGCELCAGICSVNAIAYLMGETGIWNPTVDYSICTECAMCVKVCPAINLVDGGQKISNYFTDEKIKPDCFWARTRDKNWLYNATSGGVIRTIITLLIENGIYDDAYVVGKCDYNRHLKSEKYRDLVKQGNEFQKSKYLPVSHLEAEKSIISNPNGKIIFVATPCGISGLQNFIRLKGFNLDNYLFVGLFCDGTMSYHVLDYFEWLTNKPFEEFIFRSKRENGWPGDIEVRYKNGKRKSISRMERMIVKEYFKPERCLYCLDKMNVNADIALGDCYINGREKRDGANSVIVYTKKGEFAWNFIKDTLEWEKVKLEDIIKSQNLEQKEINRGFIQIKNENSVAKVKIVGDMHKKYEIEKKEKKDYYNRIKKIRMGETQKYINIFVKTHFNIKNMILFVSNWIKDNINLTT